MISLRRLLVLGSAAILSVAGCASPSPSEPSPVPAPETASTVGMTPPPETASSPRARPTTQAPDTVVSDPGTPSRAESSPPRDVASGLNAPWSVVFRDGVALVSERDSGRILELADDGSSREVGIVDGMVHRGEGGLLGLAVDDDGRLYVYFTAADDNRIVSFDVGGTAGSLMLGEPRIILDGLKKSTTHNGGRIAFGPDGMLYATVGDAGMPDRAQELGRLSGKILRMTADGGVPPDNPFEGSLVWSWGHRNPQGIAWAGDGTMFAAEFGQNTWDELNVIEPGKNYGWPVVEGIAGRGDFVDPVQQWSPADASPSGMAYLDGTLYIANLRGQRLRTVDVSDLATSREFFVEEYGRLRHVAVTPDGSLWVVTNNTDGRGDPRDGDDRIVEISPDTLGS